MGWVIRFTRSYKRPSEEQLRNRVLLNLFTNQPRSFKTKAAAESYARLSFLSYPYGVEEE